MKIIGLFLIGCLLTNTLSAQYKAVTFDYEKVVFGENQPLPAEAHIMLQGETKTNISLVEIDIYEPKGKTKGIPLYTSQWKRSVDNTGTRFMLPINYKLKGSGEYDLEIKYYTPISKKEKELSKVSSEKNQKDEIKPIEKIENSTLIQSSLFFLFTIFVLGWTFTLAQKKEILFDVMFKDEKTRRHFP